MCGRYDNLIARAGYRRLFRPTRLPQSNFPPRYNIAPTDPIPIIRVDPRDGERELVMARWGLVPGWMKQNAEGAAHQRARRHGAREAAVQGGVRQAARPHPRHWLLRVAEAPRPDDYDRWLDPTTPVPDLRALLKPFPAERMRADAV